MVSQSRGALLQSALILGTFMTWSLCPAGRRANDDCSELFVLRSPPRPSAVWAPARLRAVGREAGGGSTATLQRGVAQAIERGLLPKEVEVEPVQDLQAAGQSADAVAEAITGAIGATPPEGCIVVLQGEDSPENEKVAAIVGGSLRKAQVWKMKTFFRALVFFLNAYREQAGGTLQEVLEKPGMLAAGVEMVEEMSEASQMGQMAADAEQMMAMSSDAATIDENIPLALEFAQGEVINFVERSLSKLAGQGTTVVLYGQAETLAYIRTPYRFAI